MRFTFSLIATVSTLVACSAGPDITPDPDTTTSTGNAMGGSPVDGGNAPTDGGNGAGPTIGGAPQGGSSPGGGYESGTRIKAKTLVGSDGSRNPDGWHDSQLDVDCQWRLANDGSRRCLPVSISTAIYADLDCTQPLMVQSACNPSNYAMVSDSSSGCDTRYRVYPIGASVTPAVAYMKQGNGCVTTAVPSGGSVFATGPEMVVGEFVAGVVEVEE